jgi:hypothetical protein
MYLRIHNHSAAMDQSPTIASCGWNETDDCVPTQGGSARTREGEIDTLHCREQQSRGWSESKRGFSFTYDVRGYHPQKYVDFAGIPT